MTMKASTGLRNGILGTNPLKTLLAAGFIKVYAGTVPTTADDALGSATLLCTISIGSSGTGINFDTAAASGVLSKAPAETWSGVNAATGTATFFRHVTSSDTGVLSTTQVRIQGEISSVGSDLNFSSTSLTSGGTQTIDYYSVALPV